MPVTPRTLRPLCVLAIVVGGISLGQVAKADALVLEKPTSVTGTVIIDTYPDPDSGKSIQFYALKPDAPLGTVSGTSSTPVPKNRTDLQLVDLDYGTPQQHFLEKFIGKHCKVDGTIDAPINGNQAPRLQFQVNAIAESPVGAAIPETKGAKSNGPTVSP